MEKYVLLILAIAVLIGLLLRNKSTKKKSLKPAEPFPKRWRIVLVQHVSFYNALNSEEKAHFEIKVQEFLLTTRITGVSTQIELKDSLLVASSAIIPIFHFKDWAYDNLDEVLVYPGHFNEKFETSGPGRNILGMVGTGYMEGKMILSKKALNDGFSNTSDKKNTAIHEFVHLIDKLDGAVDGVPELLLDQQYTIPWIDLIGQKIEEITAAESDINPYGSTNRQEFFAVASEYFFERPKLLAQKHPELYQRLEHIFRHDMQERDLKRNSQSFGRNSPCPCNSGLKYKHCCGKN